MTRAIQFHRRFADGTISILGFARIGEGGRHWRFFPSVTGRAPSRKLYRTWEASLTRWVGYPDRCESMIL
jgi:hypothetical protein